MVPALDVVVLADGREPAWARLSSSLAAQRSAATIAVHRVAPGGLTRRHAGVPSLPGSAPWALIVRESDWLAPGAVDLLHGISSAIDQPEAVAVRLALVTSNGGTCCGVRWLLRRAGIGGDLAGLLDSDDEPGRLFNGHSASGPGAVVAKEISERVIVPLGMVAQVPAVAPVARTGEPAALEMVAADPAVWTMAALSAVAGGLHPDTDSADRRWLIIAAPAWQELLRRAGSADKAALRIASGAGAVALCRTPERRPAWERFEPTVGDRLDVVALICRRRQLAAALVEARSVSDGVQRVLAQAQHAPAGCSYHWLTGLDSVLPAGLAAAERSVTIIVPGAAAVPTAGGQDGDTGAARSGRARWAPRAVLPLELVVDRDRRRLLLSSPLAPLEVDRYPERAVIGGVDAVAFPGTAPLYLHDLAGPMACNGTAEPNGALLGYFPLGGLNDCTSLYHRGEVGRAVLRRCAGVELPGVAVPGADSGLGVYRAPSPWADALPEPEDGTCVVDLPDGPALFRHPDVLGVAAQAELPARLGPTLGARATVGRHAVAGPFGVLGYARVFARAGDAAGPGAGWFGLAPRGEEVPLLRWDSTQGPRYSTGARPVHADGSTAHRATFMHVLGWVLRADTAGGRPLWEWFHPILRRWRYSSDVNDVPGGGYRKVRMLCCLEPDPSPRHVALYRSVRRRDTAMALHTVAAEAAGRGVEPLAGWIRLASEISAGAAAWSERDEVPEVRTEPGRATPWPGAWPAVRLSHPDHGARTTLFPGPLLARGWSAVAVVGFAAAPTDHGAGDELRWLTDRLGSGQGGRGGWVRRAAEVSQRATGLAGWAAASGVHAARRFRNKDAP